MHVAILYDGEAVTEWQRQAIERIAPDHRISYLIHEAGGAPSRRRVRNGLYYLLNLVAVRNRLTRAATLQPDNGALVRRFVPLRDGAWSALPPDVLNWLRDARVDAVIKFGLNLLRVPEGAPPILSYHHGDPRSFRGRPAGFYEMVSGQAFLGQVVQVLSNRLDAGRVLAFTETRVHRDSYRKTLLEAYAASPQLLPTALEALGAGKALPLEPTGTNYRLPDNVTVARFVLRSGWHLAKRLAYGAFVEKRWNVSTVSLPPDVALEGLTQTIEDHRASWKTPRVRPGYTFYADGFFHGGPNDILVEALNAKTGKGELVRILDDAQQRITHRGGGHISYPLVMQEQGRRYILPEIAGWSGPVLFQLEAGELREVAQLDIDTPGILDPTLLRHGDNVYLFGNRADRGTSELHLWVADSLFGRFQPHPASPVRVGSRGTRMAGQILENAGTMVRFGQDLRRGYGDGVIAYRIIRITPTEYQETPICELAFAEVRGPHTINRSDSNWIFDWYVERKTPLAGVRRLLSRL